jgi:hypothetical protein
LVIILFPAADLLFGQKYQPEIKCSSDTICLDSLFSLKRNDYPYDSLFKIKMIMCEKRSAFGFGFGLGVTGIFYSGDIKKWIGNHGLSSLNISFIYDKITFGVKVKILDS